MYTGQSRLEVYFNLLEAQYERHPVHNDIAGSGKYWQDNQRNTLQVLRYFLPSKNMAILSREISCPKGFRAHLREPSQRLFHPFHDMQRLYPEEKAVVNEKKVKTTCFSTSFSLGFKDTYSNRVGNFWPGTGYRASFRDDFWQKRASLHPPL